MNTTIIGAEQSVLYGPITSVAVEAAKQAGDMIKSLQGKLGQPSFKGSPKDLVTEADRSAEDLIRGLIRRNFPNHRILGEESFSAQFGRCPQAWLRNHANETIWIIDPLDGTTNFVHGLPYYCVSIAVVSRGRLISGVIYDPSADELYTAEYGKGAHLNGSKIHTSAEDRLSHSVLAFGLRPSDPVYALPANTAAMLAVAPKVRNLRMVGSAALQLAYVSTGRLSGFWEVGLHAWDICAGALLVAEAGGRVTELDGKAFALDSGSIVATNGSIHNALLAEFDTVQASGSSLKNKEENECPTFPGLPQAL